MNKCIDERGEVIDFLKERGHTPEEIEKVLDCVAAYDETALRDALFDELGRGSAFLELVIARAIGEEASSGAP